MEHQIVVNEALNQIELQLDEGMAFITYELGSNVISFMHTEVPAEVEGQGIATELAEFALNYARKNSMKVKPYCQFMQVFLQRHPEYQDLVI